MKLVSDYGNYRVTKCNYCSCERVQRTVSDPKGHTMAVLPLQRKHRKSRKQRKQRKSRKQRR
jgi:hypothetical protein